MAKEVHTNRLKVGIGRVQASAIADNYFPVIGQTVKIDAQTKWGQSSEWRLQDGSGSTVISAGNLIKQKDCKEVTVSAAGELVQKFTARNSLTETIVAKMIYAMRPQTLPYFNVTAQEIVRVGESGSLQVAMENGYNGASEITVKVYKENEATVYKVLQAVGRPTPDYKFPFSYYFGEASDRGIYDVEVDVTDRASGITISKRINKLITVTPQLCPKPDDTLTGYEVIATYRSQTTYAGAKNFEVRLWRNVNGSGLNYAEAITPAGDASASYGRIPVGDLPAGTTLCLMKDLQEPEDYPRRIMVQGNSPAASSSNTGTPYMTFEKPLIITHDATEILHWGWRSYGAFNLAENMRHVVLDGRGYNNTSIRFYPFSEEMFYNSCFFLTGGTTDFEMFSIDIDGAGFAGISAKTDPSVNQPWFWQENGWEFKNLKIHHCTIQNTAGEGTYLGYYGTGAMSGTNNAGEKVTYHPHLMRDLRMYRCKFHNTGFDPVQINNAVGMEVCYLDIEKCCYKKEVNQANTFSVTADGKIYNCKVWDNYSMIGIVFPFKSKLEMFNNILTCDKDSMAFSWTRWSDDNNPYTDDTLTFKIYNNVIKGRIIATVAGNISYSNFSMNDNVFITSEGDTELPTNFVGSGNVFIRNNEEYDVLDSYLKVGDSANYNYQPNYNSMLVSAGNNALTEWDMRGYKRWFNRVYHSGALMGIYKDESLPDASIQLLSVLINNGTPSTLERNVLIAIKFRGNPIKYRVGETKDLSSISWTGIPVDGTIDYTLSDGYGIKTVYAQVATDTEESNIVAATISYQEEPLSLDSITLSGGYRNTATVVFNYSGSFVPVKYRVSETADLTDANWQIYSEVIKHAFASAGDKTLYGQLQDADGNITEIKSATITVTADAHKAIISFGWTKALLGNQSQLFDEANKLTRQAYYGNPTFYWQDGIVAGSILKNDASSISSSSMVDASKGATTGDGSGIYPDEILERNIIVSTNSTAFRDCTINLPAGRYNLRFFCSSIATRDPAAYMKIRLVVDETTIDVPIPAGYTSKENLTDWLEQEITVPASGSFRLLWGIEDVAESGYFACPLNIVEIEVL